MFISYILYIIHLLYAVFYISVYIYIYIYIPFILNHIYLKNANLQGVINNILKVH